MWTKKGGQQSLILVDVLFLETICFSEGMFVLYDKCNR